MFDDQRTLSNLKRSPVIGVLLVTTLVLSACQQAPATPTQEPAATSAPTAAASATSVPTATSAETTQITPTVASEPTATIGVSATQAVSTSTVTIPAPFADAAKKPKVALVRELGEGSFFERYLAGAQSQAKELGIDLIESNAQGDEAKLVANLENAIQQKVDGIIIDHGRADTLRPVVQKALDAGIKVVAFDSSLNLPQVPEIEQDDLLIGLLAARQLAVDSGGKGQVIYANVNGFAPLEKRDRAWQDIKWRYPDLKEVAKIGKVSNSTAADTQAQAEAAIKANPEAHIILAAYDEFAKGVTRAIQQAGLSDQYSVYGVDVNTEDIQLIIQPGSPWKATVGTDSYNVGRLAVRAIAASIAGDKVDRYLLVQPSVITQDFLLKNKVQDIDGLVKALPELGESALIWPDWIQQVVQRNGFTVPAFASGTSATGTAQVDPSTYASATIPAPFNDTSKKVRIALVRELGGGSFFERYFAGVQSQAKELGIDILDSSAEGDEAKLLSNLENAINQKVDAIILDHGRGDAVRPYVQKALDAGIKVVAFDSAVNLPEVPEIEQDDLLIGQLAAHQLAVDAGGNAKVVYVNVNGFAPLEKRDRSWQDYKWRYPDLQEVAHIGKVTNSTSADTQAQFEAVIKSNPDATYVFAPYDEFAKGVTRAIEQAGLSDKYRVYGVDVNTEDIQELGKPGGAWKATVATDSYSVGRLAVRAAATLIAGEKVDRYLLVQPVLITQDFIIKNNIQDIDALVKALPALGESPLVWPDWLHKLAAQNAQ